MFFVFSDILRVTFVAKKVDDFSHIAFENRSLLGPFFWSKLTLKIEKLEVNSCLSMCVIFCQSDPCTKLKKKIFVGRIK